MERKYRRHEDWCPECGHLLSKKVWDCSFCGWSLQGSKIHDSGIDCWDNYSDLNIISSIDEDFDLLFDN